MRLVAGIVVLATLIPSLAYADDEAESLYREGKKAAQARDWPTACAKFKASSEREAAPGTLLNLGDCEEKRGHLRDARASFESSVRLFKAGDERAKYAKERLTAIDRRIPRLTAKLQPGSPEGTRIDLDGAPLTSKEPVLLEPGEHVLVVHAPGRSDVESRITLAENENRTVVLAAGARAVVDGPVGTTKLTSVTLAPSVTEKPPTGSAVRTTGWVVLGVGAAGLATGLVAGYLTMNAKSTADEHCRNLCDPEGSDAQDRGKTWSTVSTTAFIAGGAAAAVGLGLLVFGPSSKQQVGIGPGSVSYAARF